MTISLQHLTGTSLTLFISVFLSSGITFCSYWVFFFYFTLCGYADGRFKRTGAFFFFQPCVILLHVQW